MGYAESPRRLFPAILFSLALFLLHPTESNDFEAKYNLESSRCHRNPKNYMEDNINITKCNVSFSGACWPEITAGSTFIQPCPSLFFKTGGLIHRRCNASGHWERMNISQCRKLESSQVLNNMKESSCDLLNTTCFQSGEASTMELYQLYINEGRVFVVFSWISVSIMLPSMIILVVCRDTNQQDRFLLHKNLLTAFILRTVTYFIDYYTYLTLTDSLQTVCTGVWILNRYFAVAEVTWMTNEAVFLLRLLIRAFDNESYFWYYFFFGWGLPAFLVFTVYVPISLLVYGSYDPRCWSAHGQEPIMMILYGPITIMLSINLSIMIFALFTLVRKMQETSTPELQIARKTAKGAVILFPQMGVIYLSIFYIPKGNTAFDYVVRVIFPLQGAFTALVFVAWNSEVRQSVRQRCVQWWHRNNPMEKGKSSSSVEEHCHNKMHTNVPMTFEDFLRCRMETSSSPHPPTRLTSSETIRSNQEEMLDLSLSPQSIVKFPKTPSEMIELREIRQLSRQRNISEDVCYPQPSCSQKVPVVIHVSSAAAPNCSFSPSNTKHKAIEAPARPHRERVSTGSFRGAHDLESYICCHPIQAQFQPRMHESADSGIEEFHGEKRLSTDSMWFEEEIHLDQPPPLQATLAPFQTNRVLFSKRTSCPAVTALHSKPLKKTLPHNVREAFKGYGVCEDTKQMKEPQRLARSESLFCGSGSQVFPISSSSYAWAEGKQKSRKKVLQERSCK